MRLLLDTHAFFWWQGDDPRLPRNVSEMIASDDTDVFFSAINAYEIAYKNWLGKLDVDESLLVGFATTMAAQGFAELPVTTAHALLAGRLAIAHRDPFDRLLIAQALTEGLTLVSNEELFDRAGVSRLWG